MTAVARIAPAPAAAPTPADLIALAFIGFRIVFSLFYVADLALLRSIAWLAGAGCCIALFVIAA